MQTKSNGLPSGFRRRGFTLVEIMIVVVIIGILTLLALPAFRIVRRNSQATLLANDYRAFKSVLEVYALENGEWPSDTGPGQFPPELAGYIQSGIFADYAISGSWDWEGYDVHSLAGMTFIPTDDMSEVFAKVDAILDDGALGTGNFRMGVIAGNGYTYIFEE